MQKLLVPFQIRHGLLSLVIGSCFLWVLACDSLLNDIDQRNLSCGAIEGDLKYLAWIQIQNDQAEPLDLNLLNFSLVDSDLQALPSISYRLSSKGCLGVVPRQEFILRIPGQKNLFTRLEASDQAFLQLSVQSQEAAFKVNLEPSATVYRGQSSVRVSSSEKAKGRYCLEELTQLRCIKSSDLNVTFSSKDFLKLTDFIELPLAEGFYRLHILSETRDGNLSQDLFDFSIDNTAPIVIPDFTERLPLIPYFEAPTYFLEVGYPIKFLSLNDSLAAIRIEYCLVPQESPQLTCPNPQIYGNENPLQVARGASKLLYRGLDAAGNVSSQNWHSLSIMSQTSCKGSAFLQSLADVTPVDCQILEGDLDLSLVDPKYFPLLDQIIEVTGRIRYSSETATSVPLFRNLNAALAVDFNLAAQWTSDFIAFPQLRRLKDLDLRLSLGGNSIEAFNEITQMSRVELINFENVQELRIFRKLEIVDQHLWLLALAQVKNLDFLSSLTRTGQLRINNNAELRDVKALKNLKSIARLEIAYNPKLASLMGLEGLKWVNELELTDLAIIDLQGLQNLKEVTEALTVQSNTQLESLKGLESLIKVKYFLFRGNDRLPAGIELLGQVIEQ